MLKGAILAGVVILVALALWVGNMSAYRQVERLISEANAMGIRTEIPPPMRNADAERARKLLSKFSELEEPLNKLNIYSDTEDPAELKKYLDAVSPLFPAAEALSNCTSYGYKDSAPYLDALHGVMVLTARGNYAIHKRDFQSLLSSASAIRRIADLMPHEDSLANMLAATFCVEYCNMLQRAAEQFGHPSQIAAIEAEADNWIRESFKTAAAYLAGNELRLIDDAANSKHPTTSTWEKIQIAVQQSPAAVARAKIEELRASMDIYPKWNDDEYVISKHDGEEPWGGVYWIAKILKSQERQLRTSVRAMRLTIRARRIKAETRDWPSIEDLGRLGLETTDPISGKPYQWKKFEGKLRIVGAEINRTDDGISEGFVLLSPAESRRSAPSRSGSEQPF